MPGISNGTPRPTTEGFTDNTIALNVNAITSSGSYASSVVVIVEDANVSNVEFGMNVAATAVASFDPPSSWTALTKNNDYTTPDTINKRWVSSVNESTSEAYRGFYVRITAEDGTQQVYRYVLYRSASSVDGAPRGELSSLTIGGKTIIGTEP